MLVTCPQCGRSIEAPAATKAAPNPLTNCPSCGKFAARAPAPLGQEKPGKTSLSWLPPAATGRSERS
jgi:hypothetical protein